MPCIFLQYTLSAIVGINKIFLTWSFFLFKHYFILNLPFYLHLILFYYNSEQNIT